MGVHGPGEMDMRRAAGVRSSEMVTLSFRATTGSAPQLAQVLDEVVSERIVIVDDQYHMSAGPTALFDASISSMRVIGISPLRGACAIVSSVVEAIDDLPENRVFAVQGWRRCEDKKERCFG
jgi:hypothetical protein